MSESISSDLKLVKPIAIKMFNIKGKDSDKYFQEVEDKLIEETNYNLEIEQSKAIAEACKHLPHINSPIIMKIGLVIEHYNGLHEWTSYL